MTPIEAMARAICEGRCAEASDKPCYELAGCSVKDCQSQPTCVEMAGAAANALADKISDEMVAAATMALAEGNIDPDIQALLIDGNPMRDIPPGALKAALSAALLAAAEGK